MLKLNAFQVEYQTLWLPSQQLYLHLEPPSRFHEAILVEDLTSYSDRDDDGLPSEDR